MQDSQNKVGPPRESQDSSPQGSKSSFNHAEYERWSEKLRNHEPDQGQMSQKHVLELRSFWLSNSTGIAPAKGQVAKQLKEQQESSTRRQKSFQYAFRVKCSDMGVPHRDSVEKTVSSLKLDMPRRVWIDIDNSPHVPFFAPIIEELRKRGHEVILTARDAYQVRELLELYRLPCKVVGRHYGKNRAAKILGTCVRATQLIPTMANKKIDLAVSHGSRAQMMCAFALGIPTVLILDYEYIAMMGFIRPDWIFVPQIIPNSKELKPKRQVLRYPGLKEDVYVPRLRPNPSVGKQLGFDEDDIVVTVRPPAVEAHYHNPEAEVLLEAALNFLVATPDIRVILLPRNENQARTLRKDWAKWVDNRKITIPEHAVDGINLIWLSDLVISGGGTMNREAAALGVPVCSIFRGKIGAVDRQLEREGRLVLIQNVEDVRKKIALKRRKKNEQKILNDRTTLQTIVDGIGDIIDHGRVRVSPPLHLFPNRSAN